MADKTFITVKPPLRAVDNGDGTFSVSIKDTNSDGILAALVDLLTRTDFALDIARGSLLGKSHINKYGRNPDCDQKASATAVNIGRSIWDGGIAGAVNYLEPTQSRIHQLKSTDANDTSGGSGARTVQIYGLDSNYAFFNETKTLDGTTNVALSSFTMIYRLIVRSAGATGWNEGTITVTAGTDNTVTARITIGNNQSLMTQFMVPVGMKGYMTNFSGTLKKSGGQAKFADVFLMSKEFGQVWRVRESGSAASDGQNKFAHPFQPYKVFQAKEMIELRANPSADAQDVSGSYDLILVED